MTITTSSEFISVSAPGIAKLVFDDNATGYVIDEFEFNAEPIPEPTTLVLLGGGLVALRARRRRSSVSLRLINS